ncbi:MAG: GAF domain-containing protein [Microcoleaceae cyanobacterium]
MSNNNNTSSILLTADESNNNDSKVVPVEATVQAPIAPPQAFGLRATTTALSRELAVLRLNIDGRIDQLQSLIEKEGAAAERSQLLSKITSKMRESLNAETIFNSVVESARTALQADRVAVYQFDANWQGRFVAESVAAEWPTALGQTIDDPCFADRYVELYQEGRVKATPDIYDAGLTECHLKQLEPYSVRANLVTPILADKKLIGLLIAHQCSGPRNWSEPEIEFLRQLAVQLGYTLDQAMLLKQQEAATRYAQLLNQINTQVRKSTRIEDILTTTVEEVRAAMECDRVVVYEFDENWQGTIIAESVGAPWPAALNAKIADPCFADRYIQPYLRGRVQGVEDIENADLTECYLGQLRPFKVRANLVAPIIVNQNLMGLLIAHHCDGPHKWTEFETDFMRNVGIQTGYVLDNAYVIQQQEIANRQAKFLNDVTIKLRNLKSEEEIYNLVVEEVRLLLQNDRVIMYKFDDQKMGNVVAESLARAQPTLMGDAMGDHNCNVCRFFNYAQAYQRGQMTVIDDVENADIGECHAGLLRDYQIKADISAVIVVEGQLYAQLMIHQLTGPRKWHESEVQMIQQLCTQMSLTIEQLILTDRQIKAAEQARRLNQITSSIRESLNLDDIFQTSVDELQELLKTDRVIVYKFDESWNGIIVSEAVSAKFSSTLGSEIYDSCFAQKFARPYAKGRIQAVDNIYQAGLTDCQIEQLESFEAKASLVAPILADGKLQGLLIAHQCSGPRKWTENDIDVIRQVSTQVGFASDQALLLTEQRRAAERARLFSAITSEIRESLDTDKVIETTVKESLPMMQADRILLYRFDENWNGKIVAESAKPEVIRILELEREEPDFFPEDVEPYRKGLVQFNADISQAQLTPAHKEQLETWQVKADLLVPVFVDQKLYGLLAAHHCSAPCEWLEADVEAFKQLALQMGYALEQALLLEQVQQARAIAEKTSQEQLHQKEQLQHQIEGFLGDIEASFDGNLTVRAQVTEGVMGTVADFFNATIENLQGLVNQVKSAATVVNSTAQVSESEIKQLSQEALNQADSISNALGQIQKMADAAQTVSRNAQTAEVQVQAASQILQDGDEAMNRAVEGIRAIQKTVNATAHRVKNLGESSKKISRVVQLISEFSNQTRVLALNASVETTRTSQDSLGFATVASEVRGLAEQSATATQEIEQIVEEIQTETRELIQSMKVGMKRVALGTNVVNETRQTFTQLVEVSQQIQALVEQMSESAAAQARTSQDLSQTVEAVAETTRSTSKYSLKVADSFGQLLTVADDLQKGVTQFKA